MYGERRTIIMDVDGPVADLYPAWFQAVEDRTGFRANPMDRDWQVWDAAALFPAEHHDVLFQCLGDPNLYEHVRPVPGSLEGIRKLQSHHRVVFCTSVHNGHAGAKLRWLVRHGFLESVRHCPEYVECSDKGLIRGDIMVDDRPKNLRAFQGKRVLFMPRLLRIQDMRLDPNDTRTGEDVPREARFDLIVTDWSELNLFALTF